MLPATCADAVLDRACSAALTAARARCSSQGLLALSFSALGVIYGDIGERCLVALLLPASSRRTAGPSRCL